jgi:nitrite reductase (NADH) small subunit
MIGIRTKNMDISVRFCQQDLQLSEENGATLRDRTGGLLITNQPLYQLS